ncbi:hypothetical protein [Arthrobacter sp. ok362]|jgi:hypothetical protein|uniref:hypothetical protein n=1 Tax=Arthrobacter sp. ok362 TaxID=1761745 RepID=UPI000887E165|nr:hypothetical protein [Arthrobacter sp. ok362]SDL83474.1 hypothetical protein SAMN04487913_115110 [Arthrobacter sp. ok362]
MTEPIPALNQAPNQQPAEAAAPDLAADVAWPDLPSHQLPAEQSGRAVQEQQARVQDPAVSAVLDRLAAVRQTPVSEHGEVYAGMHDALLEALNEDVADPAGVARRIRAAGDGGS